MPVKSFKSLRYYQEDSIKALIAYLRTNKKGNGVIVLPTGAGKSYTLSEGIRIFAGEHNARVMVVSHTKKIVQQDYDAACELWPEGKHLFGINSDGLGKRATKSQVLFGGIQSVYKSAKDIGSVNVLFIDEAQRCNMIDSVQYKQFIEDLLDINPKMRVVGITATEYRMGTGLIYGPSKYQLFDDLIYSANVKELINQGYLAKPICAPSVDQIDTSGVQFRAGEYIEEELAKAANIPCLVNSQTAEVLAGTVGFNSITDFAVNIEHAENIAESYRKQGEHSVAVVHSKIDGDDEEITEDFKNGKIRVLISVNMFVEGFDVPNIQIIVDRKPTLSSGRYVQMYGRGFRLCAAIGKTSFLVFDFAGNVGYHGPVDEIIPDTSGHKPKKDLPNKQCGNPSCEAFFHPRHRKCPYCGWVPPKVRPEWEDRSNETASDLAIISEPKWFNVDYIHCAKPNPKKGIPSSIVVHYYCVEKKKFTKEISFDDDGKLWLKNHLGDDIPFDVMNFFKGGFRTKLRNPKRIYVDEAGASSLILEYEF